MLRIEIGKIMWNRYVNPENMPFFRIIIPKIRIKFAYIIFFSNFAAQNDKEI